MTDFVLREKATRPSIERSISLSDSSVSLSDCDIEAQITEWGSTEPIYRDYIEDTSVGSVEFSFPRGIFDAGKHKVVWIVRYPDGSVEIFPNSGYDILQVAHTWVVPFGSEFNFIESGDTLTIEDGSTESVDGFVDINGTMDIDGTLVIS